MPAASRSWGPSEQKIVAANQGWKCAVCDCTLPPTYELDHRTPLWQGGKDCYNTNADALCPGCHATKTQRESIERTKLKREARTLAIREAQSDTATAEGADDFLDNKFLKYAYDRPPPGLNVPQPLPMSQRLHEFAYDSST